LQNPHDNLCDVYVSERSPHSRKAYLAKGVTESEAQKMVKEWDREHPNAGKRKAMYDTAKGKSKRNPVTSVGWYYFSDGKALTVDGVFSKVPAKWKLFTDQEMKQLQGGKPRNASKIGTWTPAKFVDHSIHRNPEDSLDSAATLYESFHGRPGTHNTEYVDELEIATDFAELGKLVELHVTTISKTPKDVIITAPSPDGDAEDVVTLCSNPEGNQLYFVGGDQAIDLEALGFHEDDIKPHTLVGVLRQLTYRTQKGFHKFQTVDYFHDLGEETGVQPMLKYDPINRHLSVIGGQYQIKPEGIAN
jgi:hypothetical protein